MRREDVFVAIKDFCKSLSDYAQYDEFMDDKEIVLAGVRANGRDLKYASDRLKDNKEVVIAAISQDPRALESASARLCGDVDVVSMAVKLDARTVCYADRESMMDVDFVSTLLNANKAVCDYLPKAIIKKFTSTNGKNRR